MTVIRSVWIVTERICSYGDEWDSVQAVCASESIAEAYAKQATTKDSPTWLFSIEEHIVREEMENV